MEKPVGKGCPRCHVGSRHPDTARRRRPPAPRRGRELPGRVPAAPQAPAAPTCSPSTASPASSTTSATRAPATAWPSWTGPRPSWTGPSPAPATHPAFVRLQPTHRALPADPLDPFADLIEANRQDQTVTTLRHLGRPLLGYCRLSANPVGVLVLQVFGAGHARARRPGPTRSAPALQVVEHLQDVGEDAAAGRVYLPPTTSTATAATEADLLAAVGIARRAGRRGRRRGHGPAPCSCRRTAAGGVAPRPATLGASPASCAGGHAALDAIERADDDVLAAPSASPARCRALTLARPARRRLARPRRTEAAA